MKRLALCVCVAGLFVVCGRPASAAPLILQPSLWTTNGTSVGNEFASQTLTATGLVTFDNFTLPTTTVINQATWLGVYLNPDLTNGVPNTSRWDVLFDSTTGGLPSGLIAITSNANVVATVLGSGLLGANQVTVYQFTAVLNDFTAAAGVTYAFSPVSVGETGKPSPTFPFFGWIQGTGGDNQSSQVQLTSGNPVNIAFVDKDRAFSLSTVPEPSTMTLLAVGFGALGMRRRRRR
jgi:hypothetical protein